MRGPVVPQLDAETYVLWESRQHERFELHHGFVFALAGGTIDHSRIALNAQLVLARCFPPPCRTFGSDLKVRVADSSYYYPDFGAVCRAVRGDMTSTDAPRVVGEVLSAGTKSYDLTDKRAAYRGVAALEAYVIAHTTHRHIEIDVRNADRSWRTTILGDDAMPFGVASCAVGEFYDGTDVAER